MSVVSRLPLSYAKLGENTQVSPGECGLVLLQRRCRWPKNNAARCAKLTSMIGTYKFIDGWLESNGCPLVRACLADSRIRWGRGTKADDDEAVLVNYAIVNEQSRIGAGG